MFVGMKTEAFLELIGGHLNSLKTAHVHVITPNEVGGDYSDGPVPETPEGLTITVHNGKIKVPDTAFLPALVQTEPNSLGRVMAMMEVESKVSDQAMRERTKNITLPDEEGSFLVMYAGLRAIHSCVEFITETKEKSPNTKIFAMICDCNQSTKEGLFAPLIETGTVEALCISPHCGGYVETEEVIRHLLKGWPLRQL